jgi:putative peptide zinc metalloprotease protein
VSTLLFNGNPLLRFDAYYILSDFLEIPNLGMRSNRYVGYLAQRYLLGIKEARNPVTSPGEAGWLGFYGVASFVYRMFIMIRIAMFVAGKFFFFGIALAIWGLFSMLVMPLYKVIRYAFTDMAVQQNKNRVFSIVGGGMILAGFALTILPFPAFTVAEGVLWAPDDSRVYARSEGFIKNIAVSPGNTVQRGDVLISCENPELDAEVAVLEAQLAEFESRYTLGLTRDRIEADILVDEIERITAELQRKQSEREDLLIRSTLNGVFLLSDPEDLPGRFVRRGIPLGYVVDFSTVTARIVVPQRNVDRVRRETRKIIARLTGSAGGEYPAAIRREVPAASSDLPSLALSLEGGGALALDPREKDVPRAFEKFFQFEIEISGFPQKTIGKRVFVRFEHDPEPVAFRLYRSIRRTLLRKFNV